MDKIQEDLQYMRLALEQAALGRGYTNPNPMVGAVIVKNGQVIAKGYHHCCGQGHAEVEAFRDAGDTDVTGATMYVTLEPCSHYGKTPPCADKIIEKKIGRVVVGAMDPNPLVAGRGVEKLRNAGIEVTTGVLADESIRLNEIFMKYIVNKEPFVLYK
ncbi:MAG: bifunctional diaminohydroxyphosphoribosylaminopyrimidine deaminase/5-amino-6-(5-phosphoribosylamino)uracil reductase RibD, partial [Coprococcus sp.]